jgi:hypothetical protein
MKRKTACGWQVATNKNERKVLFEKPGKPHLYPNPKKNHNLQDKMNGIN